MIDPVCTPGHVTATVGLPPASLIILNPDKRCPHCGATGTLREYVKPFERFDVCQSCARSSGLVRVEEPLMEEPLMEEPKRITWRRLTPEHLAGAAAALHNHVDDLPVVAGLQEVLRCVARRLEREARRRALRGGQ